jgi:hypothetical protein
MLKALVWMLSTTNTNTQDSSFNKKIMRYTKKREHLTDVEEKKTKRKQRG